MSPEEHRALVENVSQLTSRIHEHVDNVQVLGSVTDDEGNTVLISVGLGDWYARTGMAREFAESNQVKNMAVAMEEVLSEAVVQVVSLEFEETDEEDGDALSD